MRKILLLTTTMLILFLSAASMIFIELDKEKDNVKVELQKRQPKKAILKWFHLTFDSSRTETLEVPEDAIWAIHGQCLEILDGKCEELAELCGWYKKHPKV